MRLLRYAAAALLLAVGAASAQQSPIASSCYGTTSGTAANSCVQRDANGAVAFTAETVAGATSGILADIGATYAATTGSLIGVRINPSGTSTSAPNTGFFSGLTINNTIASTNTQNWNGSNGRALVGISFNPAVTSGASGTISDVTAAQVTVSNNSASATVTNLWGIKITNPNNSGTVTNAVGIAVDSGNVGTNHAAVFISTPGTINTAPSGTWSVRSESTLASYFAGAAFMLPNLTTGTNADFVCFKADGTLLIQASACTISSARFKENIHPFTESITAGLDRLKVFTFRLKAGAKNPDKNASVIQLGLLAENVAKVFPLCAIYEQDMKTPKSYRQECLIAALVKHAQESDARLALLERRN